jgi:hypothetical protein
MKPPPDSPPGGDDESFPAALRGLTLRPPPAAWRDEIFAAAHPAAPARPRWFYSPFWRGMAALWTLLLVLKLDTRRITPAPDAAAQSPIAAPASFQQPDLQSLLASLNNHPSPRRSP